MSLALPMIGSSTPTAYGRPFVREDDGFQDADAVFMGIPWAAPVRPDLAFTGGGANFGVTGMSPGIFRRASLRHRGGFLLELNMAIFDRVKLVDSGDVAVSGDMEEMLQRIEARTRAIRRAGCVVISYGGNAGPSSYPVISGIAQEADGEVTIVNFDAHGDNRPGDWRAEDPAFSSWGSSWVHQMLERPDIDARRFYHVGLRGPVNDKRVVDRFRDLGVERAQILDPGAIGRARQAGFAEWAAAWAAEVVAETPAVWIAIDVDVLDMGSNPSFVGEPFGPSADELILMVEALARAAGRQRLAGLSFMAVPPGAAELHVIASHALLHCLAGIAPAVQDGRP
ncbi:arginase family protein [Conexibacter sp. S30A1]|uniref:arginase family protein n=1 Tax=Conexibacter sp. S30A1 TaxID=2937800 RepID=UPI00200EFDAA|nr:arginase family protein [Conexibacter sp. S30A1]